MERICIINLNNDLEDYIILRTKFFNYTIGANIAKTFNVQIDSIDGFAPLINQIRYTSSDNVIPIDNYNTGEDPYIITVKFRNISSSTINTKFAMTTVYCKILV